MVVVETVESCRVNLEMKWMIDGVELDFRTISDFRDNINSLKKNFHEFNKRISREVVSGEPTDAH